MKVKIISKTPDYEIVSSRIFEAEIALVFRAWSEPEHLKNWWGPAGFTNTFHQFEFKEGGKWRFTMHGPDKGNYQNECEFIKIDEPYLIAWQRFSKPIFQVLATFEEITVNKTKVIFKMILNSVEECNKIKGFAVEKNEENFDKLEMELTKMT
jgi:uncharacterized protein YndB with AHSA1/START domain